MKLFLLAAAAVIATPAMAQTMSPPGATPATGTPSQTMPSDTTTTTTATPADTTTAAPADTMQTAPADTMQSTPAAPATPSTDTMTTAAPMPAPTTGGADPAGGYQPTAPAMSGPMQPGATVTFQAAPSPDQAYPAPAPMAKYPVCKAGQYDDCIQRGSTRSSSRRRR